MNAQARTHSIRNLLVTQFFGAFNDNAWKFIVPLLAIRSLDSQGLGGSDLQRASLLQTMLAFSALTLPLILFSLPAGVLADRLSKRSVIVSMKCLEILLMLAGTISLVADPGGTLAPLVVLGLMGAQSALFSPAKFGILPELVPYEKLSWGNAHMQLWTMLAIILGGAAAGALLDVSGSRVWIVGALLCAFSVVGLIASLGIPRVRPARSEGRMLETVRSAWTAIRSERVLGLAVAGSVMYWATATLLAQDIFVYSKTVLELTDTLSGVPLALFGVGVGAGSILAARLSASKVEYGLIPLGATVMAGATLLLALFPPSFTGLVVFMPVLGIASGFLIVPLAALIQWRAPADRRGAVIALSNVFVFAGIFIGSTSAGVFALFDLSLRALLFIGAGAFALGTAWAIWLLPDALLRLALILATHSLYRLRVIGARNVPLDGPALLVPNHVSFVDALILIASLDRPIRFLVETRYFDHWLLKPFMRVLGTIPVSSAATPREMLTSMRRAGACLDRGELVCIFPEGQMTRTGTLLPFKRGLERIVKDRTAPIVPVYLDRLWGSVFSFERNRFLSKLPREIPYRVTVAFGETLEAGVSLGQIRQAIQELSVTAWTERARASRALHVGFVRTARRRPFGLAFADATMPRLSRLAALAGTVTLARALRPVWKEQTRVGILLPPSVAGALVNIAASLSGRTSVNLNHTAGPAGMASAARQAGLASIVTSRAFVEKAGIELPGGVEVIWIEDLRKTVGRGLKLTSLAAACLLPVRLLETVSGAVAHPQPGDVATVIFSSGSTGEPKGVMLTHSNIDANLEAVAQVLRSMPRDRVLGVLPLFHSFGTLALWFAAVKGLGMPMHPNPLDGPKVGEIVHRYEVTVLLTTPTFLQLYMRRCTPAQFGSIRLVLAGAEKLPERVAAAFEDHFGIRPLEGYGATECAPAIAVSAPDFRAPGFFQPGSRRGFVGQSLPGVALRVVDPETFSPLPKDTPGMLLVKGPNVMKGYLGRDDLTREAIREGWYVTGDIAQVDEDGFLKITDRISRFSKIGGEMVPHGRVEEALHTAARTEEQVFAVTAVADARRGEALVVVHTFDEDRIPALIEALAAMGLPNLFVPRKDRFLKVDRLPVLGTGKIDLKGVRRLARERFGEPAAKVGHEASVGSARGSTTGGHAEPF